MSLFSRKPLATLLAEAESGTLTRALGPVSLTTLGIGAIIGAGIFVLTGQAAADYAGPAIVISFILAGIACAFAGLAYAELASMIPVAGSAYTYAYATLGQLLAWIIGWDLILEYSLGAATVAVGWSGYVVSFLHDLGLNVPTAVAAAPVLGHVQTGGGVPGAIFNIPAALIVVLVTGLLVMGVKESARANAAVVILKLTVIALFLVAGVTAVNPGHWHPFIPPNEGVFGRFGWSGIMRGAGVIFFAYIGFDAVSTAAQETRNPGRDLPIGILASLVVCTVLYIAVSLVVTGIVPFKQLGVPDPIAVAVDQAGLPWLRLIVKLGAIAGLSSVILVMLYAQSRIFYTMAKDGLLPAVFSHIHPRLRTPYLTSILTGVVVAVTAGLFPIGILGELVSIGTLLAFVLVCLGVLVLRRTAPDMHRPFRAPGAPITPLLGAAACLYLMAGLPLATWLRLAVWLVVGFLIYFGFGKKAATAVLAEGAAEGAAD